MGRKPNALIIQHFERGAKLPDSSNRYQHTCKACGEKFPKGRIDTLTTHLVKKCPALSIQDRQNALLQLNDLPNINTPSGICSNDKSSSSSIVELPVLSGNWTALETLAEVSRQFDMSEKHDDRTIAENQINCCNKTLKITGQPRLELREQYTLENPPVSYDQCMHRERKARVQNKSHDSISNSPTLPYPNTSGQPHTESIGMSLTSPRLDEATTAAVRFLPSMVDPQLLGNDLNTQSIFFSDASSGGQRNNSQQNKIEKHLTEAIPLSIESVNDQDSRQKKLAWPNVESIEENLCVNTSNYDCAVENTEAFRSLTFKHITSNISAMTMKLNTEYEDNQRINRPKVRGRFSSSRRKEVQKVRKKGACIRCRMLKKPCSESTPCETCKNVESARLWKTPCIRTRVADELEIYSSGLHTVLAYREVNSMKKQFNFQPSSQKIEASHHPETTIFATFSFLEGHSVISDDRIHPYLDERTNIDIPRILDDENDNLASKLEVYAKQISGTFYEREPSKFMHTTLNFAQELAATNQDSLLLRTLELWSIVHILVDHEISWNFTARMEPSEINSQDFIIDQSCGSDVYELICSQLNAAAESKASSICKGVLHDLERRLLQRSAAENFETFLVVLIILNCIEKYTWLFKSWEHESLKYRWPLDKTPGYIYSHGDKLADILLMLLRMRKVPPKTYTRPGDGILASDITPIAQDYYKKLNLSYVNVLSKQADQIFDSVNSRCFELRYCSRLLLPVT